MDVQLKINVFRSLRLTWEWFQSKLFKKRTLSYITRHPIRHTTQSLGQFGKGGGGNSVTRTSSYTLMFNILQIKKRTHKRSRKLKQDEKTTGRKNKMGHTIEFKLLTHSFTRSLQKLHTRITILLSSFEERKYFSKDIFFYQKK
jgi:hypothetical protein